MISSDAYLAFARRFAMSETSANLVGGAASPIARPPRKLASNKDRTIMVVDDDAAVRELISLILEMEGYAVLKARHGDEALLFSREFPGTIHMLLTDFRMGANMNGQQLAQLVRMERPGIHVLYVSGYVDGDSLQGEFESASSYFLEKPFTAPVLVDLVGMVLAVPS